jgi:dUTP pyrophosphatase
VEGGVVDEDYRGIVCVILFNHSKTPFHIYRGDSVAQLICEKVCYPELEEVKVVDDDKTVFVVYVWPCECNNKVSM